MTRSNDKKAENKGSVKTLQLERETIKDLSAADKKMIKGGGGAASGIVMGMVRKT